MHIDDFNSIFQILGGFKWLATTGAGAIFGYWYYGRKLLATAEGSMSTFYMRIFLRWSRIGLGAIVGGWIGYMKFGDRQRLHNAWVAERLRKRYPDSMLLDERELWRLKGVKANYEFYRWT